MTFVPVEPVITQIARSHLQKNGLRVMLRQQLRDAAYIFAPAVLCRRRSPGRIGGAIACHPVPAAQNQNVLESRGINRRRQSEFLVAPALPPCHRSS